MTENEMVGWYHRLNGHEFEKAPGDGEGQGSMVCCRPWVLKESDTTEQLNNKSYPDKILQCCIIIVTQMLFLNYFLVISPC